MWRLLCTAALLYPSVLADSTNSKFLGPERGVSERVPAGGRLKSAGIASTVLNVRAVLKSQITRPLRISYARFRSSGR